MSEPREVGPDTDLQGSGDMLPPLWRRLLDELGRRESRVKLNPHTDTSPIMLDRFVVQRSVGMGGMGVVFEAFDPELGRRVALKTCKAASIDAATLMEHEARSLAKLSHPNIVAVHEIVRFGSDVVLVMEFVEGQTLRRWQANTSPTWREVLACYVDAGQAIAAVHAAGLVHADFKPDNVLIDHEGRVRVVDFGIARYSIGPGTGDDGELANVGTREYMPPERLMGTPGGPRADIYSFCVSVWESIYGARPYAERSRTVHELLDAIVEGKRAMGRTPRGLPERMRDVLVKGLAANVDERHASMADLLRAMLDVVAGQHRRVARLRRAGMIVGVAAVSAMVGILWASQPPLGPVEQTLALARIEAREGSTRSAVDYLELARTRARRDGDVEALRLIASEAEQLGYILKDRGDENGVADCWTVALDVYIELGDQEAADRVAEAYSALAEPQTS
ncbi:serine/threonine protein kinase [Nannocystaceae bacterium ST9]